MKELGEMWTALAAHQPIADRNGYGAEWERMRVVRTAKAAWDAADAAAAVDDEYAYAAAENAADATVAAGVAAKTTEAEAADAYRAMDYYANSAIAHINKGESK